MWRRLAYLWLLALLLGLAGCAVVDESRNKPAADNIPWNSRADWEGKSLGMPY